MSSRRMLIMSGLIACLVASPWSLAQTVNPSSARSASWAARGAEIVRLVREHFYASKAADAWAARHAGYADKLDNEQSFTDQTKRALSELKASHTGFYTKEDPEYYSLLAIYGAGLNAGPVDYVSVGADFTPDGFVRAVFADGPAARAGLRRGDKILLADGQKFHPVASFRNRAGLPVTLTVQRKRGGPSIEISIRPRRVNPKDEWLQAEEKGARLITRHGRTVAYVPMYACAGEEYHQLLQDLISTKFHDADALILDFRNGWGGCNPDFVNLFNPTPSVLTYISRDGKQQPFDSQWRKPVLLLINRGARSGKEVVAYSIQKHHLGALVGQTTAGAVLAGRCFLLSDRSLLLLAVADVRVDGERLEGRGVEPDVRVAEDLPFADGADPQLEKAIDLAVRR